MIKYYRDIDCCEVYNRLQSLEDKGFISYHARHVDRSNSLIPQCRILTYVTLTTSHSPKVILSPPPFVSTTHEMTYPILIQPKTKWVLKEHHFPFHNSHISSGSTTTLGISFCTYSHENTSFEPILYAHHLISR